MHFSSVFFLSFSLLFLSSFALADFQPAVPVSAVEEQKQIEQQPQGAGRVARDGQQQEDGEVPESVNEEGLWVERGGKGQTDQIGSGLRTIYHPMDWSRLTKIPRDTMVKSEPQTPSKTHTICRVAKKGSDKLC